MLEDYVLGAEIAEKGNFHIANISMLFKDLPLEEGTDYLKYGGTTLLSKKSLKFPKYIRTLMDRNDMLDLSELVPYNYFKDMMDNRIKLLEPEYENVVLYKKNFIKPITVDLKKILMGDATKTVVEADELDELLRNNLIDGYKKLAKSKVLVWY